MTITTKKRLAWWIMSAGFWAFMAFALVAGYNGSLPLAEEWPLYGLPLAALAGGFAGWRWIRRLYRIELPVPPAGFNISLTDMLCGVAFSGLLTGVLKWQCADTRGIHDWFLAAVGLIGLGLYVHAAIAASLRGAGGSWKRQLFITSHVLLNAGTASYLALGMVLALGIIIVGTGKMNPLSEIFHNIYLEPFNSLGHLWRLGLFAPLPGIVLHLLWRALERRSAKTAASADAIHNSIK